MPGSCSFTFPNWEIWIPLQKVEIGLQEGQRWRRKKWPSGDCRHWEPRFGCGEQVFYSSLLLMKSGIRFQFIKSSVPGPLPEPVPEIRSGFGSGFHYKEPEVLYRYTSIPLNLVTAQYWSRARLWRKTREGFDWHVARGAWLFTPAEAAPTEDEKMAKFDPCFRIEVRNSGPDRRDQGGHIGH